MRISRVVIKNFRSFELLDATLRENTPAGTQLPPPVGGSNSSTLMP
jgi:hypothetical protein